MERKNIGFLLIILSFLTILQISYAYDINSDNSGNLVSSVKITKTPSGGFDDDSQSGSGQTTPMNSSEINDIVNGIISTIIIAFVVVIIIIAAVLYFIFKKFRNKSELDEEF